AGQGRARKPAPRRQAEQGEERRGDAGDGGGGEIAGRRRDPRSHDRPDSVVPVPASRRRGGEARGRSRTLVTPSKPVVRGEDENRPGPARQLPVLSEHRVNLAEVPLGNAGVTLELLLRDLGLTGRRVR